MCVCTFMFLCNFLLLTGCMLLYAFQSVFVAGVFLRRSFGLACLWVGLLSFLYVFWPTQLPNTNIDLAYPSRLRWLEAMRPLTFCNEPVDQLALMKYDIQNVHLIWFNLDIKRAQKFFEQLHTYIYIYRFKFMCHLSSFHNRRNNE